MNSVTYYPLTPSQMGMFLSRKYTIHKSVINVPTSIIVHEAMDMDILEESVKEAIQRWDSFGIRLIKEGKMAKQYFGDREVESIKRLDFTNKSREEMRTAFAKLVAKKMENYYKHIERI